VSDPAMPTLLGIVFGALVLGTIAAVVLSRHAASERLQKIAANLSQRMRAWWLMASVFVVSILLGGKLTIFLFGLTSFLAFREFVTLTPTRRGDHRALFWAFFIIIPLQFVLVGINWYGLFAIFIPVYAFMLIPVRIALASDSERYLERTSKIQWGLMICVYFVSHVPALMMLDITGFEGRNASLLFFFILIVQLNDVLQYVFGNLLGRRRIAPAISPNKTWGGFIGGFVSVTTIGGLLYWTTPFSPVVAAGMSLVIALMGFAGDLTLSAVKRDLGVKDYSASLPGHGGVMDRMDSVVFAAPLFFHLTRFFYT
jgi:phosphatidate cytidylyltransferase